MVDFIQQDRVHMAKHSHIGTAFPGRCEGQKIFNLRAEYSGRNPKRTHRKNNVV